MKKKNIIIMTIIFVVLLIAVILLALFQKKSKQSDINKEVQYYEVVESSGMIFKGMSVISDDQRIFLDSTLNLETLHVEDKQEVKKGDLIITYLNNTIQEQIDNLELQYNSANDKVNRSDENKGKINSDILKKEQLIDEKNKKINSLNDVENINEKASLQQEVAGLEQELQLLKSNLQSEETTSISLNDTLKELNGQIEALKNKLRKEVTANIDGIAYINKEGLTNMSIPYIDIISKNPLVKSAASEYDVLNLKVGQEVALKVVSTGEKIKGTILSIDDLPSTGENGTGVVYNFTVKPESAIRIGFSVEVKENIQTLEIPKEYVKDENGKLSVLKITDSGVDKVEVEGSLDKDYYIISSDKVVPGDKLSSISSEDTKEE